MSNNLVAAAVAYQTKSVRGDRVGFMNFYYPHGQNGEDMENAVFECAKQAVYEAIEAARLEAATAAGVDPFPNILRSKGSLG